MLLRSAFVLELFTIRDSRALSIVEADQDIFLNNVTCDLISVHATRICEGPLRPRSLRRGAVYVDCATGGMFQVCHPAQKC